MDYIQSSIFTSFNTVSFFICTTKLQIKGNYKFINLINQFRCVLHMKKESKRK